MTPTKLKRHYALSTTRLAVFAMFVINGAALGNWVSRIPQVKLNLGLSEGTLGLALLCLSAGVIGGLLLAGGLIVRFSSRSVTITAAVLFSLSLGLIGLAFSFWSLVLTLALTGFFISTMDIAMNTQATEVERRIGRPVMSSMHAGFSIGAMVGALMGAGVVALGLSVTTHFALAAALFVLLSLIAGMPLVTIKGETKGGEAPVFNLPHPAVWGLGAVAFSAAIGEGAMADWSALYLHEVVQTTESVAAFGFAAFSLMMTVGRLAGDSLAARYPIERLVRSGGALAAAGLLLALLVPQLLATLLGFALVGAGVSITIPLAFSAAGKLPDIAPGTGIAGVATIGYAGFLAGPPVIGLLAEATSLRLALGLVFLLVGTLIVSGRTLRSAQSPAG